MGSERKIPATRDGDLDQADAVRPTTDAESAVLLRHRALALWMVRTGVDRWKTSQG